MAACRGDHLASARPPSHIDRLDSTTRLSIGVNGEERAFDGPLNVSNLLTHLGLDARKVAVERNKAIIRRAHYAETWLESGDAVEIVHFIGGG